MPALQGRLQAPDLGPGAGDSSVEEEQSGVVSRVSWHGATAIREQRAMQPAARLAPTPPRAAKTAARRVGRYTLALESGRRCTRLLAALAGLRLLDPQV